MRHETYLPSQIEISPIRLVLGLSLLLAAQFALPTFAGATTIAFYDSTYDHRVWPQRVSEQCGESGVTILAIKVDSDGLVSEAHVAQSRGYPDLDVAAEQSVMEWRYRTASKGGNGRFPEKVKVVFQATRHSTVHDAKCSMIAAQERAKAMMSAPLVSPGRMPRGIDAPKPIGRITLRVSLGMSRDEVCKPDTFTRVFIVTIGTDGLARKAEADGELWGVPSLDKAAYRFVNSLRYIPARSNGKPVQVSIEVFVTPRPLGKIECVLQVEPPFDIPASVTKKSGLR